MKKTVVIILFFTIINNCLANEDLSEAEKKIETLFANRRLLMNYVNCLLDKGKCTHDGQQLKKSIPEIMKNECNNCTEESKALGIKVFTFLLKKEPEVWKQLEKKYDPDGEFRKKHKKEIDEYLAKFS